MYGDIRIYWNTICMQYISCERPVAFAWLRDNRRVGPIEEAKSLDQQLQIISAIGERWIAIAGYWKSAFQRTHAAHAHMHLLD